MTKEPMFSITVKCHHVIAAILDEEATFNAIHVKCKSRQLVIVKGSLSPWRSPRQAEGYEMMQPAVVKY
jgi:hypothetical protein